MVWIQRLWNILSQSNGARQAPSAAPHFAVLDVETTGLDPIDNRIIECAIVELDATGALIDEWSTLIDVSKNDPIGASWIHGITATMLDGAPTFNQVAGSIIERLRGRILVGHVVNFDLSHLQREFERIDEVFPSAMDSALCTRSFARSHLAPGPRSLIACCAGLGIPFPQAHTALGDARATAALFRYFLSIGAVDITTARAELGGLKWPSGLLCDVGLVPRTVRFASAEDHLGSVAS